MRAVVFLIFFVSYINIKAQASTMYDVAEGYGGFFKVIFLMFIMFPLFYIYAKYMDYKKKKEIEKKTKEEIIEAERCKRFQERRKNEYLEFYKRLKEDAYIGEDLGLSVNWSKYNLGALSEFDYGRKFEWCSIDYETNKKEYRQFNGEKTNIGGNPSFDAATYYLGKGWRMPTTDEINELINRCKWEKYTKDDLTGFKITGITGKSIYILTYLPIYGSKNVIGEIWTCEADAIPIIKDKSFFDNELFENCDLTELNKKEFKIYALGFRMDDWFCGGFIDESYPGVLYYIRPVYSKQ